LTLGFDLIICRPFSRGWTLGRPSPRGMTNSLKNITSSLSRFDGSKVPRKISGEDDVKGP
jgi:hypothetical protein